KDRSLPVRMRAREFAAASVTALPMAWNVDSLSALRLSGRLMVTVVTSPLTSVRTLVDNATPSYESDDPSSFRGDCFRPSGRSAEGYTATLTYVKLICVT